MELDYIYRNHKITFTNKHKICILSGVLLIFLDFNANGSSDGLVFTYSFKRDKIRLSVSESGVLSYISK